LRPLDEKKLHFVVGKNFEMRQLTTARTLSDLAKENRDGKPASRTLDTPFCGWIEVDHLFGW
jgi:hypothetical protein